MTPAQVKFRNKVMEATITIDRNNSTDTIQGSPQEHTQGNQELLLQDKVTLVIITRHVQVDGWVEDTIHILSTEEPDIRPHISRGDLLDLLAKSSMEQIQDFVGVQNVQEVTEKFSLTMKQVLVGQIISHLGQK